MGAGYYFKRKPCTKPRISNDGEQHAGYKEIDKFDTNLKDGLEGWTEKQVQKLKAQVQYIHQKT